MSPCAACSRTLSTLRRPFARALPGGRLDGPASMFVRISMRSCLGLDDFSFSRVVMKKDDAKLMSMVAEGDMDALEEIYRRHSQFVYRVALRFLGNESDASDITHALFVDLVSRASKYKSQANLSTWLYRVAVNRCINWTKAAPQRLKAQIEELDGVDFTSQGEEERLEDLDRSRRHAEVREAVASLPPRQKMAVTLRDFEGLSYKEISKVMGCSRRAVESLLTRARRALLKTLNSA